MIQSDLEIINSFSDLYLIDIDLNSKHSDWNNFYFNRNSKVLNDYLTNFNCAIDVSPIHFISYSLHKHLSTIEFFFSMSQSKQYDISQDLNSDHRSVFLLPRINIHFYT